VAWASEPGCTRYQKGCRDTKAIPHLEQEGSGGRFCGAALSTSGVTCSLSLFSNSARACREGHALGMGLHDLGWGAV
jgi:hypothetical protein